MRYDEESLDCAFPIITSSYPRVDLFEDVAIAVPDLQRLQSSPFLALFIDYPSRQRPWFLGNSRFCVAPTFYNYLPKLVISRHRTRPGPEKNGIAGLLSHTLSSVL